MCSQLISNRKRILFCIFFFIVFLEAKLLYNSFVIRSLILYLFTSYLKRCLLISTNGCCVISLIYALFFCLLIFFICMPLFRFFSFCVNYFAPMDSYVLGSPSNALFHRIGVRCLTKMWIDIECTTANRDLKYVETLEST